ncbi:MAG: hypothetical protein V4525_16190 [Pseudomonadota bacterium]
MVKHLKIYVAACLFLFSTTAMASTSDIASLDDAELASVQGLGIQLSNTTDGMTRFTFQHDGANSKKIEGSGDLSIAKQSAMTDPSLLINNNNSLILRDNAQNNLSSIVNVNAVNSAVQVLLNLNININSQIGSMVQGNKAKQ